MGSEDAKIIIIFVSSAALVVGMAVLVALFVVIYQKRMVSQKMEFQQLENDFQQEMLLATISGQERERKRLAKELHDGIGSLLSGLNLNLKQQLRQVENYSDQHHFLEEACEMLQEGMVDVRRMSHNLMPVVLENFGLVKALEEWIEPLNHSNSLHVDLSAENTNTTLPAHMELGLFRVCQELLHNTLRHAKATHVSLSIICSAEQILLHYSDNGLGLNATATLSGIGIKNMQSRVHALGGTIDFSNQTHNGFWAKVLIPLSTKS